jgi:hypothetical protein
MAVTQISRIKLRRGLDENINKVLLQEGEMGFTTDSARLFVGSPNYDNNISAPRTKSDPHNVEVLTELTPVAALTRYNYNYRDTQNPEFPTPLSNRGNSDYYQFLQEKLDESVSIKSYGAVGNYDPVTTIGVDDTTAIRKAAVDVTRPGVPEKRALYFPAGFYKISRPLIIPPNSTWIGDGINKTVIFMTDPNCYTVARTIPAMSISDVDEWDWEKVLAAGHNYDVPELEVLFSNITSTSVRIENLSLYGITFVYLGFEQNDMLRQSPQEDFAVLKLIYSANVDVTNCSFEANWTNAAYTAYDNFVNGASNLDPTVRLQWNGKPAHFRSWQRSNMITTDPPEYHKLTNGEKYIPRRDTIGVLIDSYATGNVARSENFSFTGCVFKNSTYAFNVTDNVNEVIIMSCKFDTLYRAVNLNQSPLTMNSNLTPLDYNTSSSAYNEGPKNFKMTHNRFGNIKDSAIYISRSEPNDDGNVIYYGHVSSFNTFENIGFANPLTGGLPPVTPPTPNVPAIFFDKKVSGCTSISDIFSYEGNLPLLRVTHTAGDLNVIINAYDGAYSSSSSAFNGSGAALSTSAGITIQNNRSVWTDFVPAISFNTGVQNCIILDYSVWRSDSASGATRFRMGTLKIITTGHQDGTNWTDDFVETGPDTSLIPYPYGTGVLFNVQYDASGNTVKLQYKSSDLPNPGTGIFKYTTSYWDGTTQ